MCCALTPAAGNVRCQLLHMSGQQYCVQQLCTGPAFGCSLPSRGSMLSTACHGCVFIALQLTASEMQIRSYVFDVVRATVPSINLDDVFTVSGFKWLLVAASTGSVCLMAHVCMHQCCGWAVHKRCLSGSRLNREPAYRHCHVRPAGRTSCVRVNMLAGTLFPAVACPDVYVDQQSAACLSACRPRRR
jgi:hypothetical protein